ncbi:hypothetical protein N2152v2_011300 [Parachlorella kessleri]
MFARLTALVSSGSSLPFELGEPLGSTWGAWAHFRGTAKADGSSVSVFRISAQSKQDPKLVAARNGAKRLRMLRHPNILAFKETVEIEERGETVVYIMTEAVTALSTVLRDNDLKGLERQQYMAFGLHQIVSALSFLNNECKLIHGNVCQAAVVVTEQLDWKLHGFDLLSEHQWAGGELPLMSSSWLVASQYKPGEVAKSDWQAVRESPPWAVDAWGLGCLMQELYSGSPLARMEDLRNTEPIPKDLLQYYQRLLASSPERRLNPAKVAEAGVLKNRLVEVVGFLENLSLKEASEKDTFFKKLPSLLPSLPRLVAQRKLLPQLAGALEFGGAPPVALNTLLQIGDTLEKEDYAKQVVPAITKLFASNDRGIRRSLLEHINSFGPAMPDSLVEEQIYNHVATGFNDANAYLRELTLKSMAVLGPKLTQRTLNQSLLKHLAKLQVDEEPSIRANTTVLLGNLAGYLSEATCRKVLLNAFTRATKDAFPPSRVAGIKAITATAKYHTAEDASQRILPTVGPLCTDPVHEVRTSALKCLEHFLKVLQDNHAELERRAQQAAQESGAVAAGAAGGSSLLTSFGWAVSSLGLGNSSKGDTTAAPSAAPAASSAAASRNVEQEPLSGPPPNSGGLATAGSGGAAAAAASGVDEGWAGDDGLDDIMDDLSSEMEARKRLSKLGVGSSRPSTGRTAAAVAPAASSNGSGSGWQESPSDGDGWEDMDSKPALAPRSAAGARRPEGTAAAGRQALGARRVAGTGTRGTAGGMRLGANKLGAAKVVKDDDFW